jgi:hypothetical protein
MSEATNSRSDKSYEAKLAVGLMAIGAIARLLPHPANFIPVGAMSLFSGARLRGWKAYALPIALMALTDPLLSRSSGFSAYTVATPFIYASFLINVWLGRRFLQGPGRPARIISACLLGSVQFFLITNAVWFQISGTYPGNGAGLMASYVAGLPFFGRTVGGDLAYAGLLFGLHAWLSSVAPFGRRKVTAQSEAQAA